jgi:hypothetical protein
MATILHESFVTATHHNDWTRDDDSDSDSENGDETTVDNGLIFVGNAKNEDNYCRNSIHY